MSKLFLEHFVYKILLLAVEQYNSIIFIENVDYTTELTKRSKDQLKELQNDKRKIFLCHTQKKAKTQPTFQTAIFHN